MEKRPKRKTSKKTKQKADRKKSKYLLRLIILTNQGKSVYIVMLDSLAKHMSSASPRTHHEVAPC